MSYRSDEFEARWQAELLWEAGAKQKIVWVDAWHYTAGHLATVLGRIVEHFSRP